MTLARAWRRQLCAASGAALIVPSAMVAALVVLALGGGFSRLGVLGQIFAGPPALSAGSLAARGAGARVPARTVIPVIPVAPVLASRPASSRAHGGGRVAPRSGAVSPGVGSTGGTIAPGGPTTRPVPQSPVPPSPRPQPRPTPVSSSPSPPPSPAPSPQPTPVDTVVTVVTSVTSQVPAPVGPAVTQVVQSAGGAADNLLPKLP